MGVRRVRDAEFWGVPVGTVIAPGMKPRKSRSAAAVMGAAKAVPSRPANTDPRPGSAAAAFAAGAGKGRLHARTSRPMGEDGHAISIRGDVPRPAGRAAAPAAPKMARLSDEQLRNGLAMHGTNTPTGRKVAAEIQRRAANPGSPKTARGAFDSARVADVSRTLNTAANRAAAEQAVANLTGPQLRGVAKANGVTIGRGWTVARIREQLVESLAGRRLDSKALSGR